MAQLLPELEPEPELQLDSDPEPDPDDGDSSPLPPPWCDAGHECRIALAAAPNRGRPYFTCLDPLPGPDMDVHIANTTECPLFMWVDVWQAQARWPYNVT